MATNAMSEFQPLPDRIEVRDLIMTHISDMREKASRDVADAIVDDLLAAKVLLLSQAEDGKEIADILQCSPRSGDVIARLSKRGFVIKRQF